jgi:hypothetical protein
MTAPDLAGYKDALLRKRAALGSTVTFRFPAALTWPVGTVLNPDSGKPYDPLLQPEKEEAADPVEMSLSVGFRPTFQEDTDETEIGDIKMNVALTWVTLEEWADVEDATSFDYADDNYLIRKATWEAVGGESWRVLVWGERQTEAS